MNAAGDNWAYDPESLRIPSYTPTPTTRVLITPNPEMILDDMRSWAESLLTRGCMPLLAPLEGIGQAKKKSSFPCIHHLPGGLHVAGWLYQVTLN